MFRIGEFSKMGKTTIAALRYYDEVGLLKPEKIDDFSGYRFYTTNQLFSLHRIQSLRQIGLSIDEIHMALSKDCLDEILIKRRIKILDELSIQNDQLSRIDFMLQSKEDFTMNYVATVKELPECIVYSKKLNAPNYDSYSQLIPDIGKKVKNKYPKLKCATPDYCYMVYLDGEYKEKDINSEFCEAVTEMLPNFEDIVFKRVEAVTAVSVMHKGPYSGLREAYAFAIKWVEENGYSLTELPREQYIDGIWNKKSESEWLTELQFPIGKKI